MSGTKRTSDSRPVSAFPWWYYPLKTYIPLGVGLTTAGLTGLLLLGALPIPASLAILKWVPVLFSALTGLKSALAFGLITSGMGALVGTISAFFTRSTLVLNEAESKALKGFGHQQSCHQHKALTHLTEQLAHLKKSNKRLSQNFKQFRQACVHKFGAKSLESDPKLKLCPSIEQKTPSLKAKN